MKIRTRKPLWVMTYILNCIRLLFQKFKDSKFIYDSKTGDNVVKKEMNNADSNSKKNYSYLINEPKDMVRILILPMISI